MKKTAFALLLCLISGQSLAFHWRDLWTTPDQQAAAFMQKKEFSKAAALFQNSPWRAAAAYRAGDFKQAAELYGALQSLQGSYNQGNALAKMGRLQEALKAYDQVLASDPKHSDALFNRKLVQALLDKQQQDSKNDQKQDENKSADQNKSQDQSNNQSQNKSQDKSQDKSQQNPSDQTKKPDTDKNAQQQPKNLDPKKKKPDESRDTKNTTSGKTAAEAEQQQSKEQWLRLIPDDPGGLLREKFLRDYLRRQGGWDQ